MHHPPDGGGSISEIVVFRKPDQVTVRLAIPLSKPSRPTLGPHRQFVLTIPKILRGSFRKRRDLLHHLFKTATARRSD